MQSPLHRLYKTKFVLASLIGIAAGYLLMAVGNRVDALGGYSFLKFVDLHDIGIVLMTSGLIVVLFTYLGNEDAEQDYRRRNREDLRAEAPAFVASVIDAMAFTPKQILDVTAPDVVDKVVENSLAKQLGNTQLAADVYTDLKAQILSATELWRDLRISATLSRYREEEQSSKPMFVATLRFDYHVAKPARIMRFASVASRDHYRELHNDPRFTEVWYVGSKSGLDGASLEAFQLIEVTLDGRAQKATRMTRPGSQQYIVDLGSQAASNTEEVAMSFTYRGLVLQHGHLLYIDLTKPTKGLSVNLSYSGAGISYVNVTEHIAAAKQPAISQSPASDPNPSVSLNFDGWAMPKAGITFTWELEDEQASKASDH